MVRCHQQHLSLSLRPAKKWGEVQKRFARKKMADVILEPKHLLGSGEGGGGVAGLGLRGIKVSNV